MKAASLSRVLFSWETFPRDEPSRGGGGLVLDNYPFTWFFFLCLILARNFFLSFSFRKCFGFACTPVPSGHTQTSLKNLSVNQHWCTNHRTTRVSTPFPGFEDKSLLTLTYKEPCTLHNCKIKFIPCHWVSCCLDYATVLFRVIMLLTLETSLINCHPLAVPLLCWFC